MLFYERNFHRFKIPHCSKTFVFAFETRDLYNLLHFEYSLLDSKGKLLKFADGEDEIPAINFSIQIVY